MAHQSLGVAIILLSVAQLFAIQAEPASLDCTGPVNECANRDSDGSWLLQFRSQSEAASFRAPGLADSPWPIVHQNLQQTGSSPRPGLPRRSSIFRNPRVLLTPGYNKFQISQRLAVANLVVLTFEENSSQGALWGSGLRSILRARASPINKSADSLPTVTCARDGGLDLEFHGSYSFVNSEGWWFSSSKQSILKYKAKNSPWSAQWTNTSKLKRGSCRDFDHHAVQVPNMAEGDNLVGMSLLPDGFVVYVTKLGLMGTVSQDFKISGPQLDLSEFGNVSNSISQDGKGGIFTVATYDVVRVDYNSRGNRLTLVWASPHTSGDDPVFPGRLGTGVGSTPSLMEVDGQFYVVVTDGKSPMHLMIYRASDGNLMAKEEVLFGNSKESTSEQSVLVMGNRAMVVNNFVGTEEDWEPRGIDANSWPFLVGRVAYGVAQYEFAVNRSGGSLTRRWMNPNISCASSIPTASSDPRTPYAYCIGKRGPPVHTPSASGARRCADSLPDWLVEPLNLNIANTSTCGDWTVEALDWETGKSAFHVKLGSSWEFNPMYAATEIGPDQAIYAGTLGGFIKVHFGKDGREVPLTLG